MENIIFEYKYKVEYHITFKIKLVAKDFTGTSNFCISIDELRKTNMYLKKIYKTLAGEFRMSDYDSDDFLLFIMKKNGHMTIEGQIGGSHNENYLNFKICLDQTHLLNIIETLDGFLID